MSENTMPEQDEVALNGQPTAGEDVPLPAALQAVDKDKMAAIREKLKKYVQTEEKTESGSEAVVDGTPGTGPTDEGKDVDWSEYDLEFSVKHLYPQAKLRQTPQGPKWVYMANEFLSNELDYRNHGLKTQKGELRNLGDYLNDMMNSPDGWGLAGPITPTSLGRAGVLLHRLTPIVLPDPQPLKKETEVEPPRDPELQREEKAALDFMAQEGLTPPAPQESAELGEPEMNSLEAQALALNPATVKDPGPLVMGEQRKVDETVGERLKDEVAKAREGEDFGEV